MKSRNPSRVEIAVRRPFVRVPLDARRDQDVRLPGPFRAFRPVPPLAPAHDPGRPEARGPRRLGRRGPVGPRGEGPWAPPSELTGAFQGLPSKLKMLAINDSRETLPGILASLPGGLQRGINTAMALCSGAPMPPGGPGNPAVPGSGRDPGSPRFTPSAGTQTARRQASRVAAAGRAGRVVEAIRPPRAARGPRESQPQEVRAARVVPGRLECPECPEQANPAGGANMFAFQIDASKLLGRLDQEPSLPLDLRGRGHRRGDPDHHAGGVPQPARPSRSSAPSPQSCP